MFDLKEYLSGNSIKGSVNESLQSTVLAKSIIYNPAENFKYLTFFSQNENDARKYEIGDYVPTYNKLNKIISSQHGVNDLNSGALFKYIPFAKYIYELIYFIYDYVKCIHGSIDRESFMNLYKRYMIIYREWEKAIKNGIFKDDMSFINAFNAFLPKTISGFGELTDSNFKKYTYKEAKSAGSTFIRMKKGCILFFFSAEEHTMENSTKEDIILPKDSLLGISGADSILYDIFVSNYEQKKTAVDIIRNLGFTDTYTLKFFDETLEIPYICGLRNFILSVYPDNDSLIKSNYDYNKLYPFNSNSSQSTGTIVHKRKRREKEIIDDIEKDCAKEEHVSYVGEIKQIINEMNIYDFAYLDFKTDAREFLDNGTIRLGNIFNTKDYKFGFWGSSEKDYVYVLEKDYEYKNAEDYGYDNYASWKKKEIPSYTNDSVRYDLRRGGEIGIKNSKKVLSKSENDFLERIDTETGKLSDKHILSTEESQFKNDNFSRYMNKLESFRNTSTTVKELIDKIRGYRNTLENINETLEKLLDVDIISFVQNFDDAKFNSDCKNELKKISDLKENMFSLKTSFVTDLNNLTKKALAFSQSNKNYLDGKFQNAYIDLPEVFRTILLSYKEHSGSLDDEKYSKLNFKEIYIKMKKEMFSLCTRLDDLSMEFKEIKQTIKNNLL